MADSDQVYRGNLDRLLRHISEGGGLDLKQYREAYVERRVATRMRTLNLHTYRQYSAYLETHPDEYSQLLDTLTINVTDFYRDGPVYNIFQKQVIPEIIRQKQASRQRLIRVWSAGCATGEEPYSIVMSFLNALGPKIRDFMLTVLATDIDPRVLEVAKRAEYDIAKLRQLSPLDREQYVEVLGSTFRFKPNVTQHVKFRTLNLFEDKPIQVVDVVFCRNVFIYFNREQQEKVLWEFWESLHRGGYLVLGRSEKMAPSLVSKFELVDGRQRVYRKPLGQ